jgi:hypothetical protein
MEESGHGITRYTNPPFLQGLRKTMKKVFEPKFECKASHAQSTTFSKKHDDSLHNYKIKQISKDNLIIFQKISHPWQVSEYILETWSPGFMRHHPLQHYAY